jgi:hypothetical protein
MCSGDDVSVTVYQEARSKPWHRRFAARLINGSLALDGVEHYNRRINASK